MQHKQNDFIVPALRVILSHDGQCGTKTIKDEVHLFIELSEEDRRPYESRRKSEPRYRQTVGNLISHQKRELLQYIDIVEVLRDVSGRAVEHIWKLNKKGYEYLTSLDYIVTDGMDNTIVETDANLPIISPLDQKKLDALDVGKPYARRTETGIKEAILILSEYKCLYAKLIGETHASFITDKNKPYMEVHHFIPLKAASDFFPRNLDRPSNMICLCPKCHDILHHGSREEKEKILRVLYDDVIDMLNAEEIYISFSALMKYYD